MFQWSKKVVKSVSFNPGVADESLLGLVESYLEKNPHLTFSDLCKEALWQALCVPEAVRPGQKAPTAAPTATMTTQTASPELLQQLALVQRQLADLEERFFCEGIKSFGGDGTPNYATYSASCTIGTDG